MADIRRVKGSTVIEMAYIIPLFFLIFVIIINTVFYFHDKAVLNGAAAETAVAGAQMIRRKGTAEYDLDGFFMERIKGKLIYMTDVEVNPTEDEDQITVSVSAQRKGMKLEIRQCSKIVKPEELIRCLN